MGESDDDANGDNLKTKTEALEKLRQQEETWKEWFTGSKAAEEQKLEAELQEGFEAVEKMRKTLAFNRKVLEQAEERMRDCNDPSWRL